MNFLIPYGKSITIKVKAIVNPIEERTEIQNSATVTGEKIQSKTSNIVKHVILPYKEEPTKPSIDDPNNKPGVVDPLDPDEPFSPIVPEEDPDDPSNPKPLEPSQTDPTEPTEPTDPTDPTNPVEPSDPTEPTDPVEPSNPEAPEKSTYSIEGIAWLDENVDGQRQNQEEKLNNINVMLVNTKNSVKIEKETKTDKDGKYKFTELETGNYVVIFQYDTKTYALTQYQKNGVDASVNSDAISKEITLNGYNIEVGIISITNLKSSINNMDIGLLKNQEADIKLDKYISKVTVNTKNSAKQYAYENAKLAKVEIPGKEIDGTVVEIEYNIIVTNQGKTPTSVNKIVDYLPSELQLSSKSLTDWKAQTDGSLICTSIAGRKIEPGKSIILKLVATKTMTAETTGTYKNAAEIKEMSINDIDSIPGNKAKNEDDYSEAEVIVSIKTGVFTYISVGMIIILIAIAISLLIFKKQGCSKTLKRFTFIMIFGLLCIYGVNNIDAWSAPYYATFTWVPDSNITNDFGSIFFSGVEAGNGKCIHAGDAPYDGRYTLSYYSNKTTSTETYRDDISFSLVKNNGNIHVRNLQSTDEILYGPFTIASTSDLVYSIDVIGNDGYRITNYTIYDTSNRVFTPRGTCTFYIRLPFSIARTGIKKVTATATKSGKETTYVNTIGTAVYIPPDVTMQWVETYAYFDVPGESYSYKRDIYETHSVIWTDFNTILTMRKVDTDTRRPLKGVTFSVSGPGYNGNVVTDETGKFILSDIEPGYYYVREISNPYYGYTIMVKADGVVDGGAVVTLTMENDKTIGDLKFNKIDQDTNDPLPNVKFKIYSLSGYVVVYDSSGRRSTVVGSVTCTDLKYTSNEADATTFISDSSGWVKIYDIISRNYQIIEIDNPHYGYKKTATFYGNVTRLDTTEREVPNPQYVGNLVVEKKDRDTKTQMPKIGFKIRSSKGYVVAHDSNGPVYEVTGSITLKDMSYASKENATLFITDSQGRLVINDILIGDYAVEEVSNPYYGYKVEGVTYYTVERKRTAKQEVLNTKYTGHIKINKQDADSKKPMSKIGFKIRAANGQYVVAHNSKGPVYEVTGSITLENMSYASKENATLFITDSNGTITINDLLLGTYVAEEVSNPYYGYEVKGSATYNIIRAKTVEQAVLNEKQTGNIKLTKLDTDSRKPIEGISFKVKCPNGQYLVAYNNSTQLKVVGEITVTEMRYTSNINNATEFITNSNGIIGIYNIWKGNYQLIETSVGNNETYELDKNYITWTTGTTSGSGMTASLEVERQKSQNTDGNTALSAQNASNITFNNKRKYIKISGYAWEDLSWQEGKETERNDKYKDNSRDINDKLLSGIPVTLKKANNEIADIYNPKTKTWSKASAVTGSSGEYNFSYLLIEDIPNCYIEFQYNGLSYDTVAVNTDLSNGNKAAEKGRQAFNDKFNTIKFGQATYSNGQKSLDLKYDTSKNNISQLYYRDDRNKSLYNYGYSGNEATRDPITGVDSKYTINASTFEAYNGRYLNAIMEIDEIRRQGVAELKNINLGIKAREKVDLSVVKDLEKIKVHINGQNHIYNYADRFNKALFTDEDRYNMSPAVKFGTESSYGKMSYTRALYASDIFYEGDDKLSVTVTYKIGIKNTESSSTKTIVNEIVDYYDTKYLDFKVGTTINDDGSIKDEIRATTGNERVGNYIKKKIPVNLELMGNEEKFVYIALQVNPQDIKQILGDRKEIVKLDNIVEISSYSVKDKNNNSYASIDKDSQPDNIELNNIQKYEDDTDKAPGIRLVLQESRKVTGIVFEDKVNKNNSSEIMSGQIRQGDGIYDASSGDKGIKDVTVTLKDKKGNTAKIWNNTAWVDAIAKTDSNGNYKIEGFIPDEYNLVYTWGDKEYKVQEYKSTIVDEDSYTAKGKNIEWYKDEFKKQYPNVEWNTAKNAEIRRSDAIDNYETRQKIDKQTSLVTNSNKQTIEDYQGQIELEDGNKEQLQDKMDSSTPIFKVNIEYDNSPTNARDEVYETNSDGTLKINPTTGFVTKKSGKENHLKSIDFGIVERAKQAIELNKSLKSVKLILANGNTYISAKMENGKLQEETNSAVFLPAENGKSAQLKMEIDSEIIESAQLRLEYSFEVNNISEIDYNNKNFYMYGKGHGEKEEEMVTLDPTEIVDYLDNSLGINEEESIKCKVLRSINEKYNLREQGLLDKGNAMKELLDKTSRVLLIENELSQKLKPIGEVSKKAEMTLIVSKLLSNVTGEDTMISNNAEIIKIHKSGGANLVTTPGNYIPNVTISESDDDRAEDVVVLPPTGKNLNYTSIILLAISILGIFTSGIILIKKYVLKK